MYFPIDYYRFQNYQNIDAVFVSNNIVSISFSRKRCENESDLASYRSFPIVFIPTHKHFLKRAKLIFRGGQQVRLRYIACVNPVSSDEHLPISVNKLKK
jgi:D-lyxose ketol-isomerase